METRVVSSHLPADLADKLDWLAERLDRPKGWVVKAAIASYIAMEEDRQRLTLEALADVKSRRTYEHAEIEAWARNLRKSKRNARRRQKLTPRQARRRPNAC